MDHLKKLFIVLIAVAMLLSGAVFRTDVRADEGETAETTEVKEGEAPEVTEAEETIEVTLQEEPEDPVIEVTEGSALAEEKQEEELPVETETTETPVPEIVVEEVPVPSEEPAAEVAEETETVIEVPAEAELPAETEETVIEETKEELPAAAPLAVPMLKTEEVRSGEDYAYAGLNEDGNLFFFRSNTIYENDRQYSQVEDTDGNTMNNIRVFTGVEDTDPNALPWESYKNDITDAWVYSAYSYTIAPKSTQNWFKDCSNLASFSSIGFDFNNVTSSRSMFEGCTSLQDVSVSGIWENLTDMGRMFYECSSLGYLDMSGFQTTSALNYMAQAFEGCISLGGLSFSSIDTSGVTSMSGLFRECSSMEWLDISCFDTRNVTTMSQMFYICENLQNIYYGENFKTSKVGNMSAMYGFCESLTDSSVEIVSTFDTSKVGTMQDMFYDCKNLTQLDVSNFYTSNVESMSTMFGSCESLTSLDVSGFDTSKVTLIYSMFSNCKNLTTLDVSGFDVSKVANYGLQSMFQGCEKLNAIDVSDWDVSGIQNFSSMFEGCKALTSLDLGKWNAQNGIYFGNMFRDTSLNNIVLSKDIAELNGAALPAGTWTDGTLFLDAYALTEGYAEHAEEWAGTWTRPVLPAASISGDELQWEEYSGAVWYSVGVGIGDPSSGDFHGGVVPADTLSIDLWEYCAMYEMSPGEITVILTALNEGGEELSETWVGYYQYDPAGADRALILFDLNGVTDPEVMMIHSVQINKGQRLGDIDIDQYYPTGVVSKVFEGWCFDPEGTNEISYSYAVNENMTLYAKWKDAVDPIYVTFPEITDGMNEGDYPYGEIDLPESNGRYSLDDMAWALENGDSFDGTFEGGNTYYLVLSLMIEDNDYLFPYNETEGGTFTLYVNGDEEDGYIADGSTSYLNVRIPFRLIDTKIHNLRIDEEGILHWDLFPGATYYHVQYDDGVHYVGAGAYDGYYDIRNGLHSSGFRTGDYTITVIAEDARGHEVAQGEIVYHYVNDSLSPTPYNVRWDGFTVRWDITPPAGMTEKDFQYNVFFYENDDNFITWTSTGYGENYYDMTSRMEYKDTLYYIGVEALRVDWARSEMVYSSKKPGRFTKQEITIAVEGDLLTASELIDDEGNPPAFWYIMYDNGADIYTGKTVYSMPTDLKELLTTGGVPEGTYHFNLYAYNTDWITLSELSNTVTYKYTKPVPVTGITLNRTTLSLEVGKSETLKATVTPSNADNKAVVWKSSNVSVATVDSNGKVTALKAGSATISATTKDGGKIATCTVTVTEAPQPTKPVLVNIYNSSNGADIRWQPMDGVSEYVIMRKEGTWAAIKTVSASSLTKDGGNYKYIDTEIKENYGSGYIYSVAIKNSKGELVYDTKGLALYRLNKPLILTVEKKSNTSVYVTWKEEDCQGYELQYSSDNGKNWTKVPETKELNTTVNGLDLASKTYVFRLRTQKTNKDRGTTWSQYSDWAKVGTHNSSFSKPTLVNVYNSANGADIRWKPQSGVDGYVIMRKEKGVWHEIAEVSASSLTKAGGNYKFIDIAVKEEYGAGYIYSVAVRNEKNELLYDTKGLAFYRLKAPTILSVTADGGGKATVTWSDEVCQGYELQVSTDNGEHWGIHPQTTATSKEITGLTPGVKYVFRVRCQKTNASRGTVWSSYSAWGKVTVK